MTIKDLEELIERLGPAGAGVLNEDTEILAYIKSEVRDIDVVFSYEDKALYIVEA